MENGNAFIILTSLPQVVIREGDLYKNSYLVDESSEVS